VLEGFFNPVHIEKCVISIQALSRPYKPRYDWDSPNIFKFMKNLQELFQRLNEEDVELVIQKINYDSDLYQKSLDFRFEILRKPLGLLWSKKDLDGEESQFHIVAISKQKIVGTVVLKPISKTKIKLRQMAVDSALQGNGIGKKLVLFAENLAKSEGFREIEMIARISALDFYKKLGYETAGNEFEEVTVRSINMTKNFFGVGGGL
jgi:N-acetylglutamate synthase-like GNAT family acetyltransferase